MTLDGIPRRSVESDPVAELMGIIRELKDRVAGLERAATLRNASISGGDGLRVLDNSGNTRVSINTTDGAVVAYNGSGAAVARFGPLANSNPGQFGVEVLYNGSWVQVGAGNVDWGNVSNKPATFPPSGHTHSGGDITSAVANATNASSANSANWAAQADGSSYGFSHPVAGTSFYALWVGNDAGYHFGTNTSSARYKTNIKRHRIDPARLRALKPVSYEKTANEGYVEYGLIAEQVLEAGVPEIVQWMDGKVHGLRYDLLSVALLEAYQDLYDEVEALKSGRNRPPKKPWHAPDHRANNPPPFPETHHPYSIEED